MSDMRTAGRRKGSYERALVCRRAGRHSERALGRERAGNQHVSEPERPGPLSGLLVADFSRVLAGPYATMLLADLGADVIKVESPGGDDTRSWVPPVTEDGVSTYFLAINRNKRSVALDLKDDHDAAMARALAQKADIFVQNFKPGGLRRYGLDYASASAPNPGGVSASIRGS